MHWTLVLLTWLVAQPLAAVVIGGMCSGGRREKRVAETVLPAEAGEDKQLTPILVS